MKKVIGLTMVVMLAAILLACGSSPAPTQTPTPAPTPAPAPTPEPSVIRVTAVDLWKAYDANVIAADMKYKDKIVQVTGVVDTIGKEGLTGDDLYITLTSSEPFTLCGVQCWFDKKHEAELAKLTKGQTITVQGRVDGRYINVYVRGAVLVSSPSTLTPAPTTQPQKPEKEEIIFTVKITKSSLSFPPRKIAGQEVPNPNIAVRLECNATEGVYVHSVLLRSDIAEQTYFEQSTLSNRCSWTAHCYLPYERPRIEVTLLGINEEVLFHAMVTIQEGAE